MLAITWGGVVGLEEIYFRTSFLEPKRIQKLITFPHWIGAYALSGFPDSDSKFKDLRTVTSCKGRRGDL